MAIKLTVNYVDLKLTVDTDATEAVSTFVFAKSTVSYVNLTNTLAYTQLTAADVLTDADSKNLWLSPEYDYWGLDESGFLITMSDATALATALAKAETSTVEEDLVKVIGKPVTDTPTLSEVLEKTVHFVRTASDSYSMADAIDSVDTGLGKTDTATLSEVATKLASLGKTETATLSEAATKLASLGKTDTATLSEALANAFSRPDTDAITLAEADIKTFGLGKTETTTLSEAINTKAVSLAKTETPTMSDVFSRTVTFVRSFADAYTLDDEASATDVLQTDSILVKGNIVTISEAQATSVNKPSITASVSMQETSALAFSSPEADSLSLSEAEALAVSLGKTDSATITESIDVSISYLYADSVTMSDSPVLGFSVPFSDGPTLSEQAALAAALAKTETLTLSEALVDSFSKVVTDSATITESISVVFVPGGGSILNTAALNTSVLN